MNRLRYGLLLIATASLAAGCTPKPPTITVTLTRAQLQKEIAKRFPVTQEKFLITATLRKPEVILREGDERIGLGLEAELKLPVLAPVKGRIAAVGDPVYDSREKAFFFRNPKIEKLGIPGLEEHPEVKLAVEALAGPVLQGTPVYRLEGRTLQEVTAEYVLREVSVQDGKLHLTLGLPEGARVPFSPPAIAPWMASLIGLALAFAAGMWFATRGRRH
jgi:hypothetical protein